MTAVSLEHETLLEFLYLCPVGVARIDRRGVIALLNATGARILMPLAAGREIENFLDLMDEHDPELRCLVEANPTDGTGMICERRQVVVPVQGSERVYLELTLLAIGVETIMVVFEDSTRVIMAEETARELMTSRAIERGRSELAAEVLHDIGNAVVGVGAGSARLLEEVRWPELGELERLKGFLMVRQDALAAALGERKAKALGNLVAELLAALEARRVRHEQVSVGLATSVHHIQEILNLHRHYARSSASSRRERVSLGSILQDALRIQESTFTKRGILVPRSIEPNLPKIEGDRTRLVQLVVNLLRNACDSFEGIGPEHTRRVEIEVGLAPGGEAVELVVSDNGRGFEPDRADWFFDKHATTKEDGTGLGLYNSRKTALSHGGSLTLTSAGTGQGAVARLTLPLRSKDEETT